jgi:hypothetical protein
MGVYVEPEDLAINILKIQKILGLRGLSWEMQCR